MERRPDSRGRVLPRRDAIRLTSRWTRNRAGVRRRRASTRDRQGSVRAGGRRQPGDPPAAPGVTLHEDLVAALQPESPAAGRYRTLRARIETLEDGSPRQILAVTSPTRGDGKTLTGSNLALTMAQEIDSRTLLIDAHLRRPRLHALFGLAREPGLVDVLIGRTPLDAALVTSRTIGCTCSPPAQGAVSGRSCSARPQCSGGSRLSASASTAIASTPYLARAPN